MARLLGIDAGTSTVSSVLYEAESGAVLARSTIPHQAYLDTGGLTREQDLERVFAAVHRSVNEVCERSGDGKAVDGVSVTGQMHGFTILDSEGEALLPFITWEDQRAMTTGPDGRTLFSRYVDAVSQAAPPDSPAFGAPGYASVNLFILASTDSIPGNARWIVTMQDWLLMRLTGGEPRTDPTFAHSTGLFDPGSGAWYDSVAESLGIDRTMLPPVVFPGSYAGGMRGFADSVACGTPVFVGMGDNQASFLAAVRDPEKEVLVTVGTGSQVSLAVEKYVRVDGLDTRPFIDNRFLLVGASLAGGRAYALVHEFLRETGERVFHTRIDDEELYLRMGEIADPDTDLLCRPTFTGTRTDSDLRGSFERIGPAELLPGPFVGSVIRGIAAELAALYRSMGIDRRRLVATGNGVRRNDTLLRCLGEEFSMTAGLCPFEEEAALGAALTAGVGLGVYAGFDAITTAR